LSSVNSWNPVDGAFNYEVFFDNILELLDQEDEWGRSTLEWWNKLSMIEFPLFILTLFREVFVCKPGKTVAPRPTKTNENRNSTVARMKARRAEERRAKEAREAREASLRDGSSTVTEG
jgi:hypothetical protein